VYEHTSTSLSTSRTTPALFPCVCLSQSEVTLSFGLRPEGGLRKRAGQAVRQFGLVLPQQQISLLPLHHCFTVTSRDFHFRSLRLS